MNNNKVDYNKNLYFIVFKFNGNDAVVIQNFSGSIPNVVINLEKKILKSSLFWDVTQRRLVVNYVLGQPIGPIFKGRAVQDGCPKRRSLPLYAA